MLHKLEKQIDEIKDFITKQLIEHKEIMSFREATIYLDISKSFLYKLTCSRKIPFHRPGQKLIFFKRTDLDQWRLNNRVPSAEELTQIPIPKGRSVM